MTVTVFHSDSHRQVIHQLIEKKQCEIRKVHPGLTCFGEGVRRIEVKDIPGICEDGKGLCASLRVLLNRNSV